MSAIEIPEMRKWLGDLADLLDDTSRLAFLEIQCGSDKALIQKVWNAWRKYQPRISSKNPPPESNPQGEKEETPGSACVDPNFHLVLDGKYQLIELIGEGGMGSIYKAQDILLSKTDRFVAVKLIKSGLDSKKVLARFRAERTAISVMDHPAIAKIYDAGTTPTGLPYFVMELVPGQPITTFCDKNQLTIPERLKLFIKVCEGIQHAHQKGIIHRDIKPGNILVMRDGEQINPKVIDFGVAKALWTDAGEGSQLTSFDSIIGTPEYMSPEQASFSTLEVDTRTDVYSLGVLLFELITGSTPFDRRSHAKTGVLAMLEKIRETDPPTPSIKLSTEISLSKIAANRKTEPGKLANLLKGELDWIILKALDKNPNRRYESPGAMGRDLQKYLNDEVVEARPPGKIYQIGKFVRRYKIQVIAAAIILLALIGGMIGTTIGLVEALRQKAIANAAETKASERAEYLKNGIDILTAIFKNINPNELDNTGFRLEDLISVNLDKAIEQIKEMKVEHELDRAKLLLNLANSQKGVGKPEKAVEVLTLVLEIYQKELGPDNELTLACLDYLGRAYLIQGNAQSAIKTLNLAWEKRKAVLGEDHGETIETMGHLALAHKRGRNYEKAIDLLTNTLDASTMVYGENSKKTLYWMSEIGSALINLGKYKLAIDNLNYVELQQTPFLSESHSNYLLTISNIAIAHKNLGTKKEFLKYAKKAYDGYEEKLPSNHVFLLRSKTTYSSALFENGFYDTALKLSKESYSKYLKNYGAENEDTWDALLQYAKCSIAMKDYSQSIVLLEEVLKSRAWKPLELKTRIHIKFNLIDAYKEVADLERAISYCKEILKDLEMEPSNKSDWKKQSLGLLGFLYLQSDKFSESEKWYTTLVDQIRSEQSANRDKELTSALIARSFAFSKLKLPNEAIQNLREALAISTSKNPDGYFSNLARIQLGSILAKNGETRESLELIIAGFNGLKQNRELEDSNKNQYLREAAGSLSSLYRSLGKAEESANWKKIEKELQISAPPLRPKP